MKDERTERYIKFRTLAYQHFDKEAISSKEAVAILDLFLIEVTSRVGMTKDMMKDHLEYLWAMFCLYQANKDG